MTALLTAPALAAGDVPGDASTGATLTVGRGLMRGVLDASPDADWYRVKFERGQDYAARMWLADYSSRASVTLRGPDGRPIDTVVGEHDSDSGFEFQAPATGTYFLDVSGGLNHPDSFGSYLLGVMFDCRDATSTRCALQPGLALQGTSAQLGDWDQFVVSLDASRRYDLAVSWSDPPTTECVGELLDAGGAAVARTGYDGESPAQILSFRPGRSGKHQLRVKCTLYGDGGAPYRVSLTRR